MVSLFRSLKGNGIGGEQGTAGGLQSGSGKVSSKSLLPYHSYHWPSFLCFREPPGLVSCY